MTTPNPSQHNERITKVNRNLLIGFSTSLTLLVLSAIASIISIQKLKDSTYWVNHTYEVIQKLEQIFTTVKETESAQRGYLLSRNEAYLNQYSSARTKSLQGWQEVKKLTADNPRQQSASAVLEKDLTLRMSIMQRLINDVKAGKTYNQDDLEEGRQAMSAVRSDLDDMENHEKYLLEQRTLSMNTYGTFTPIFILLAAGLALITTVVFYFRVRNEFERGNKLQAQLQEKDEDITRRIGIIEDLAGKIAKGNYDVRANDTGSDGLGSLAGSINRMASGLQKAFLTLSEKEWQQTGLAGLNERMLGEKPLRKLANDLLAYLVSYSGSLAGTLYLVHKDESLECIAGFGVNATDQPMLKAGEGLAGKSLQKRAIAAVNGVPEERLALKLTGGVVTPSSFVAVPLMYDGAPVAVVELASAAPLPPRVLEFINGGTYQTGVGIQTAINRARLQELLEETQSQSEELQAQQHELENINAELEAQAHKLQASEEELRVQQEELMQANQELEERSSMLEEKNQLIAERNIEIQKRSEELALSTKYKSEFLANMSHELRTPLNSILLLSRLLADNSEENLNSEQVEYAQVIQSSGHGLLSLIDEILDLSKIESGKMELELSQVPLSDVTGSMKALFGPLAREKNVELKLLVAEGLPVQIQTDKMRLEQILKNLLSNAFKFTTEGSVTLALTPSRSGWVNVAVTDTGIGIAPEKQGLVFEAFQQADGSTRRRFGGTGLGLSISRELSRLLGGTLSLTSEPGKGSTFTLEIPLDVTVTQAAPALAFEPAAVAEPKPVSKPEIRSMEDPERSSLPPGDWTARDIPAPIPDDRDSIAEGDKTVLIVEDDTAFARSVLDFTRKRGYKGIVSVRGDEALELALKYSPAAVLLDIRLPVKSGWQVMEELKTNGRTRHIPVHIMSSEDARKESLQRGAVDFISKPFAFEEMGGIFSKLEFVLNKNAKKVLIVEENTKHAKALAHYLSDFSISSQIAGSVNEGVNLLQKKEVDCVILDMGIPNQKAYETLETVKKNPGMENLPIIIFTGKSLSRAEEQRIKQYADSIVVKTAHSYRRMLDEVSLFLHLMEEQHGKTTERKAGRNGTPGTIQDVLRDKTVLIADDDVRNIFSLSRSLEPHGVKVISATDGREALKQLEEHPETDLVLMDMMMPEMDGYESTTRIRNNFKTRNLPVIAVTAKTMMGDREKCIAAGASDYISKPVDVDQLTSLLRVWLYEK